MKISADSSLTAPSKERLKEGTQELLDFLVAGTPEKHTAFL